MDLHYSFMFGRLFRPDEEKNNTEKKIFIQQNCSAIVVKQSQEIGYLHYKKHLPEKFQRVNIQCTGYF